MWACGTEKAPGFDGYTFKFFTEVWEEIKEEVYAFVLEFLNKDRFPKAINIT